MPRKKSDTHFLKYGYWNYPAPIPVIEKALAEKPELLKEFRDMLESDETVAELPEWAARHKLPVRIRKLIDKAMPKEGALYFDEVEIGFGSGPEVGSMVGGPLTLYARREAGMIHYRENDGGWAPNPTEKPLDIDTVYSAVMGDLDYGPSEHAAEAEAVYLNGERTLENVLDAIDSYFRSGGASSAFYDLDGIWRGVMETAMEDAREEFAAEAEAAEDDAPKK